MSAPTAVGSRAPQVAGSDEQAAAGGRSSFAGLGQLVRFVLRRDRIRIGLWALGIIGLVIATLASITGLYNTPADLERYARTVQGSTALIIQAGPGYGLDDPTTGAVVMNEVGIWTLVAVGLMSVFMMVRHTRTEEETERAEMIRALPVGRHAQLAAALIGTAIANVIVAVGVMVSLVAYDLGLVGSVAFAASMVGVGLVFAGVAAVSAQLAGGSRAALAIGGAAIAVSFVVRAIGDVNGGTLSWLSPLGWGQAIRAYADERWWVLALPVAGTAALVAVAVELQSRRDLGAGMLPQRAGPAVGGPRLATPLALAVRLQRGSVIGWTVGVGLLAFFYGIVANQAESIIEDNPEMEDFIAQLGEGSITDAFLSTSVLILALMATGFTVASVLRLRSEELANRADPLLATKTPRHRWAMSHVTVSVGGTVLVMLATGLLIGLGLAAASGDTSEVWPLVGAAMVMVPAMLVFAGVSLALFGWSPRWSIVTWGFFAFALVAGMLGGVLDLPQWVMNLSPFEHVPALPSASMEWLPIAGLSVAGLLLASVGLWALDRRDIA